MPSGHVHNLINIAAYSLIATAVLYGTHSGALVITPAQAANFTLAYAAGTFLLSPDLDLSEGRVNSKRYWGIFGVLWVPYGVMFSHRGLSHTWILGPLTRLLYLGAISLLIYGLATLVWPHLTLPQLPRPLSLKVLLPITLGYYVSQWLHLIADGVRPDHGMKRGGQKLKKWRRTGGNLAKWK